MALWRSAALFVSLLLALSLSGCSLGYIIKQGYIQARLLAAKRPISEVLSDPSVSSVIKERLNLVRQIKEFGVNRLGLDPTDSYSSFVQVEGDSIAYIVAAAPKDRLVSYRWHFPLIGWFPYKGFFLKEDALAEKRTLELKGFDTVLYSAIDFSSLGFFEDPVYSCMLKVDEYDLADLLIHELVHGTLFFKDRVDFNERLATFVGKEGAKEFIAYKYGKDSIPYREVLARLYDERLFSRFIEKAAKDLNRLYRMDISRGEKLERRERLFETIRKRFRRVRERFKSGRVPDLSKAELNNAVILLHRRYLYETGSLRRLLEALGGDLRRMISFMKEIPEKAVDPERIISDWLERDRENDTGSRVPGKAG